MYQYTRGYANGSCLNRAASGAQLAVVIAYSATVALGVAPHGLVFSFLVNFGPRKVLLKTK